MPTDKTEPEFNVKLENRITTYRVEHVNRWLSNGVNNGPTQALAN